MTDTPQLTDLGSILRATRHQKGISIRTLADEARVSRHAIKRIELGRENPDLGSLRRIVNALDRRNDSDRPGL